MVVTFGSEPDQGKRIRKTQGLRIRTARKMRGITIAEMASALGVHASAISQWEAGRTSPRPEMQIAISRTLGCAPSFLFNLDAEAVA